MAARGKNTYRYSSFGQSLSSRKKVESEMEFVSAVSSLLLYSENLDSTLQILPGYLSSHFGFPVVEIDLLAGHGEILKTVGSVGVSLNPSCRGVMDKVMNASMGMVEPDVNLTNDTLCEPFKHSALRSFICKPIQTTETVLGTLLLADERPRKDAPKLMGILRVLAHQTAMEIERRKAEKNRQQLEKRIQQSEKMEAIGDLAGGIAHDFNNILGIVTGFLEVAINHKLPVDSPALPALEKALKASHRGADLVKRILAFSRQEEQEKKPVHLGYAVKDSLMMLKAALPANIEIRQKQNFRSDLIEADQNQIVQILMNLCTNAAHAMGKSGGILEVGVSEKFLDENAASQHPNLMTGDFVELTVKDNGHGVAKEIANRIFEPYFTTKPKGEGTGMGLAAVHKIVMSHGGAIAFESAPEEGTEFRILFPCSNSGVGQILHEEEAGPRGKGKILLVDDEEDLLYSTRILLEGLGYDVITACSGMEAEEIMKTGNRGVDLILSDYAMPAMTGTQLAASLKTICPETPMLIFSGRPDAIKPDELCNSGILKILSKPLTLKELGDSVHKALCFHDENSGTGHG